MIYRFSLKQYPRTLIILASSDGGDCLKVLTFYALVIMTMKSRIDIIILYRVSHFETDFLKWLWGIEGPIFFLIYGASGGADICVSSTSFQKNDIGWPQQPPTERVSIISEKLDFWWSILQKGTVIGHLGARDDQTIMISRFFDEIRLLRSSRPLRSLRLQRF